MKSSYAWRKALPPLKRVIQHFFPILRLSRFTPTNESIWTFTPSPPTTTSVTLNQAHNAIIAHHVLCDKWGVPVSYHVPVSITRESSVFLKKCGRLIATPLQILQQTATGCSSKGRLVISHLEHFANAFPMQHTWLEMFYVCTCQMSLRLLHVNRSNMRQNSKLYPFLKDPKPLRSSH